MKPLVDVRRLRHLPLATLLVLLCACGQKGPLYLPAKPAVVPPVTVQPAPVEVNPAESAVPASR